METVFLNVRLPRVALAVLVGAALSAAGAAYQGIFQNPMASPDVLGASSGAGFGAALSIILGLPQIYIAPAAFLSGVMCVWLVILIGRKAGTNRIVGLILSGMMIGSLFTAGTSYLKLLADPNDQLPAITYWLMGSLAGNKTAHLYLALLPVAIGLTGLLLLSWKLNLLTLGDDEARTLGVNVNRIRLLVMLCATLLTAVSVAVSGVVGWVGLVVPHWMRKLVGNDYRYLTPASALGGGIFLLLVDDVSRTIWTSEVPLGVLTAFIGAPFFLYLLTRRECA